MQHRIKLAINTLISLLSILDSIVTGDQGVDRFAINGTPPWENDLGSIAKKVDSSKLIDQNGYSIGSYGSILQEVIEGLHQLTPIDKRSPKMFSDCIGWAALDSWPIDQRTR